MGEVGEPTSQTAASFGQRNCEMKTTKKVECDLEECARRLVEQLKPQLAAQCLLDTARKFRVPLWVYVVALLRRMYSNGEYTAPALDVIWTMRELPLPDEFVVAKCETCGRTFNAKWPNQRFCSVRCSPPAPAGTGHSVGLAVEPETHAGYTSRVRQTGVVVEKGDGVSRAD